MSKITFKVLVLHTFVGYLHQLEVFFKAFFLILKTSMKINMKQGEEMTNMLEYEACV
jgi:hypothetical protein